MLWSHGAGCGLRYYIFYFIQAWTNRTHKHVANIFRLE
uniref:Uncharacterized protein n=1 Tax=Arundo donax TaxID=35708 RepID=A0A0A8Z3D9_ARUDO